MTEDNKSDEKKFKELNNPQNYEIPKEVFENNHENKPTTPHPQNTSQPQYPE